MSTRSTFDTELENLHLDLLRMSAMVQDAIDKAVTALKNQDQELAESVIEGDKEVDNIEKSIEARALRLLLQQQPVARDLRAISTALKLITDIERVGDHAADISEITVRLKGQKFIKELIHIPLMADVAIDMVKQALDAFIHEDEELAKEVIKRDDVVDNYFEEIKNDLVDLIRTDKDNADQAIDLLMVTKYLERVGDHATNIAEWAIFNVTGLHKDYKVI